MEKVFVKLKDQSAIFHDPLSGASVARSQVAEMSLTGKVKAGLKGGALIKVDEKDAKAYFAKNGHPEEITKKQELHRTISDKHNVKQLRRLLDEHDVEYEQNAKKAALVTLAIENDLP